MAAKPLTSFIRSTFRSVWALELLLHLKRHSDRAWASTELVAALRASDLIVTQSLEALVAAGLVVVDEGGSARYQPASADLGPLVDEIEALYARSPDAVRRMIVSAASTGLSAFADAFKLRWD